MRLKFILSLFTLLVVSSCSSDDQHELVGRASPYMRIQNMMGETLRMQLHGFDKPALVNIWATWCKPCLSEFKSLEEVKDKFQDKNVQIVAVSNEDFKGVPFSSNLTFPFLSKLSLVLN